MNAGDLDCFVTVQSRTVTRDTTYGHEEGNWGTFASRWASVQEDSASESDVSDGARRVHVRRYTVRMRRLDGITASMRVLLANGTVLSILGIVEAGKRTDPEHVLTCEAQP